MGYKIYRLELNESNKLIQDNNNNNEKCKIWLIYLLSLFFIFHLMIILMHFTL